MNISQSVLQVINKQITSNLQNKSIQLKPLIVFLLVTYNFKKPGINLK